LDKIVQESSGTNPDGEAILSTFHQGYYLHHFLIKEK
jgi:hypothetical protein